MRLKISTLAGSTALALVLSGCGGRSQEMDRPEPGRRPVASQGSERMPEEIVRIGEPYEIAGKKYEPRDDVTYDETGYAGSGGDWAGGPGVVAVVHRTLPIPSYVEITHLDTGRTILARVVDRGPYSNDRVLDMSPGAASALGATGGTTAIRVRRVNPPEAEKAALRQGMAAPTRLDTPPSLLSALRRRLNEQGKAPRVDDGSDDAPAVAAKPAAKPVTKPVAKAPVKKPAPVRVVKHSGADFEGAGGVTAPQPAPIERPAGKFVVEGQGAADVSAPPEAAPRPVKVVTARPAKSSATAAGPFFIQLGSFADRSYAEAMAAQAEAQVYDGGAVWRVRLGPFATRAEAEQALGPVQGNGYPQARISR